MKLWANVRPGGIYTYIYIYIYIYIYMYIYISWWLFWQVAIQTACGTRCDTSCLRLVKALRPERRTETLRAAACYLTGPGMTQRDRELAMGEVWRKEEEEEKAGGADAKYRDPRLTGGDMIFSFSDFYLLFFPCLCIFHVIFGEDCWRLGELCSQGHNGCSSHKPQNSSHRTPGRTRALLVWESLKITETARSTYYCSMLLDALRVVFFEQKSFWVCRDLACPGTASRRGWALAIHPYRLAFRSPLKTYYNYLQLNLLCMYYYVMYVCINMHGNM